MEDMGTGPGLASLGFWLFIAAIVGLARTGDRNAFAELVRRRQSWIRNLMRRCARDTVLADDLAQQVFLKAWRDIHQLRQPHQFGAWLKRLAINVWLGHSRSRDVLQGADEDTDIHAAHRESSSLALDLDQALAILSAPARLCVILSHYEGMTHDEIAEHTSLPLGTVKSHIRRGTQQLKEYLSAYREGH